MLALGVVAIGAMTVFAMCERRETAALDARQRELQATVDRAERTMRAEHIRGVLSRLDRVSAERPASQEAPGEQHSEAPDPAPPEAAPPSPADYMAYLGNAFAGEAMDAAWSRHAAELVTGRLAAAGDRSLRSVECHTSMCQLVTDEAEPERAWQQIRSVLGDPGDEMWSGAYFSRIEQAAGGGQERVTYLFRSGMTLPSI